MDTFINWLNTELEERGWSLRELARRADMSPTAINDVVNYRTHPTWNLCANIANALDMPTEHIFRLAGLLPSLPPAVEDAQEADQILRRLTPEVRQLAMNILRSLPTTHIPALRSLADDTHHPDPRLASLIQLWDNLPDWKQTDLIQQAYTAQQKQPPQADNLEREIEEFLQQFPELQNIIAEAKQHQLPDQAIRALIFNVETFAQQLASGQPVSFTNLHKKLSEAFERVK